MTRGIELLINGTPAESSFLNALWRHKTDKRFRMPTELEEVRYLLIYRRVYWQKILMLFQLVGFIAHPSEPIRQIATENLVPYSTAEPSIFKTNQLLPIKHLKFLIRDHPVGSIHN